VTDTRTAMGTLATSRDRILRLAAQQEGLFHQAQLDLPCATTVLDHLARQGEVVPVRPDVYRHAAHPEHSDQRARASWIATDGETLNRDRCDGARPRRAVIGGSSAARRFGLALAIDPLLWICADSTWPTDGSDWMLGDVDDTDVMVARGGYPYTSLERTISDALLLGATPRSVLVALLAKSPSRERLHRHHLVEMLDRSTAGRRLVTLLPDPSLIRRNP